MEIPSSYLHCNIKGPTGLKWLRKEHQSAENEAQSMNVGMANPITVFFQCMESVIKFTHGNNPDMKHVSYPVQLDMKT